jgi:hypothetical protein
MPNHEIGCLNHCPGGGGGGRKLLAGLFMAVAVIVAIMGYKVRHGIETGVEIGLWVAGGVVGLILASIVTLVAVRIARRVRAVQAQRPAPPEIYAEPAYQITQMGTHRTVRGAIEAPKANPETDPRTWLDDNNLPEQTPAPEHRVTNASLRASARENPRSRAPRQEADPDEARYHSRFR